MATEYKRNPNLPVLLQTDLTSARAFSGMLQRVFSRNHRILEDRKSLSEYDPQQLMKEIVSAEPILDAFEQGLSGDNPTAPISKRYSFLKNFSDVKKRNKLGQYSQIVKLDSRVFSDFDDKIDGSLIAHAYFADRYKDDYVRGMEFGPALSYKKGFEKVLEKEESSVLVSWIFTKRLLVASKQFSLNNLKRFLDDRNSTEIFFRTKEDLFNSLSPSFYFFGWTRRLTEAIQQLEAKLPKSMESVEAKQIMLARMFARIESGGVNDLMDIFVHLQNGNIDAAKEILINLQVNEIIKNGRYVISRRILEGLGILGIVKGRIKQYRQEQEGRKNENFLNQLEKVKELSPDPLFQWQFARFETLTHFILLKVQEKFGVDLRGKSLAKLRVTIPQQDKKLVLETVYPMSETTMFRGSFPTELTFSLHHGVLTARKFQYTKDTPISLVINASYGWKKQGKSRPPFPLFTMDVTNYWPFFELAFARNWQIEILS